MFSPTHLVGGSPTSMTEVPYVNAVVELPRLGRWAVVTFLVDTGADMTVLNPQDSLRLVLGNEWSGLTNPITVGGAGAGLAHFPEPATLHFLHDDGRIESVPATTYVGTPDPRNMGLESLLGRDVLANFVMTFDQMGRNLTLA